MKRYTLFLFLLTSTCLSAQVSTSISIDPPGRNSNTGMVTVWNPSEIGRIQTTEVDNSNIRGSAFWKNDWNDAIVYLSSGNLVKLDRAKLNLNTKEIYFLDRENVMKAIDISTANKVIFLDKKDSSKTLAAFQKLTYNSESSFFEVLNAGDCQLLKLTRINLRKLEYNPMLGKDEYNYDPKATYYILQDGKLTMLPALNKKELANILILKAVDDEWLTAHNNKLRNEADILSFLAYYTEKK